MPNNSNFLKDLFMGSNNEHWDWGRVLSGLAMLPLVVAEGHNMMTEGAIDIMALGGGIAAVITASAVLIGAKDYVRNLAVSQAKQDALAANGNNIPKEVVVVNPPEHSANVQDLTNV